MKEKITSFDDIMNEQKIPAVAANEQGIISFINHSFIEEYGWLKEDVVGYAITKIMPSYMRDAHNLGFSRFFTTGTRRILDKEIPLPVLCKNGTVCDAMHFITAKKIDDKWQFAALIKLLE